MIDDVARYIGSATRAVQNLEHHGKPARAVVVGRTFDTTVDDAWDAVTNAERIPRWFLPVTGDLRPGGRFQLKGNAGGTITSCEPPHRFEATWEYGGDTSWIIVRVSAALGGQALVELEHIAHVDDGKYKEFGPGAVGVGWDMGFVGLFLHLTPGRPVVNPQQAMAWFGSAQGKEFVRLSSDDWCRANIVSGADAGAARESAERTRAAYTGESPNT